MINTLNPELLNNELNELEMIEKTLLEKTGRLKSLIKGALIKEVRTENQVTWGPGRAIPQNIKDQIAVEIRNGKSGREIAEMFKVSLPSVYKIRETMGIVKRRSMFG
jgi:hypothetical protein